MGGNTGNDLSSNPFAALLRNQVGAQGGAQVGDGANSPSTTSSNRTSGFISPNTNPLPNPWSNTIEENQQITERPVVDYQKGAVALKPPGIVGLGGLGLPDMEHMVNGVPDAAGLNQLLQNPAVSQMMRNLLSIPQYMNQILSLNPQLRGMFDMNPQLREMMQNPDLLRQLTNPETMQRFFIFDSDSTSHPIQ
ncbi:Ubiquitin domain-containing protein DSK2a [Morella rubra]|uniref:Ubiquitin domain-containing protein DSK2a n=1 Tax=Morella rubra TaxID=262757 RepID=A0A6A1W1T3_9ROSI|nr:Ubiquitin domain-containing protein DSK2a [Morella rubra]